MNNSKTINLYPKPSATTAPQQLTVSSSAVSLTSTTWLPADAYFLIEVQSNSMYVSFDGTTPSVTNGFIYTSGTREVWSSKRAAAAKFIQVSAGGKVQSQPMVD
jgi:hypothetical protein